MSLYPKTAEGCIDSWIRWHVNYGTLPKTIKGYASIASIVIRDLRELNRQDLPYKWTAEDVTAIRQYWIDKGLTVKTQRGYDHILRALARYFKNESVSRMKVRWPYDTRPNVRWLNLQQARTIVSYIMDPQRSTPLEAICIHFMLCMGLRRVEVIRMKMSDLHLDAPTPYIEVDGKGHKLRKVPLARTTMTVLDRWFEHRAELIDEAKRKAKRKYGRFINSDHVIVYVRGATVSAFSELHPNGFDAAVTMSASLALQIQFNNHTLRRTFGRELYYNEIEEDRVDLLTLSEILGHESTDMTKRYIGADTERMAGAMLKTPF